MITAPRSLRVARFFCVAAFSYIFTFIAGQIITGHLTASAAEVSRSSAMPHASFAITLAVAGAITNTSACFARLICAISLSATPSNISQYTSLCVSAWKVSGVTNSAAFAVRTTFTSKPLFVSAEAIPQLL